MEALKQFTGDLGVSRAHAGKACFARKGYIWGSRAKQLNGRRKVIPSFFMETHCLQE